jgi:hypothetical protein
MDTAATFSERIEQLGKMTCIHPKLKELVMETLTEQLEGAVKVLEDAELSEEERLAAGVPAELRTVDDLSVWTDILANIMELGKLVLELPVCVEGKLPADLVKKWQETFGAGFKGSNEILVEGWEKTPDYMERFWI